MRDIWYFTLFYSKYNMYNTYIYKCLFFFEQMLHYFYLLQAMFLGVNLFLDDLRYIWQRS